MRDEKLLSLGPGSPLGEISSVKSANHAQPYINSRASTSEDRHPESRSRVVYTFTSRDLAQFPVRTGNWNTLENVAPQLVKELNPEIQAAAARATFVRSGSLEAAISQIAADIVLGAAEHAQGFGIITAKYRITPKGLACEIPITNADGFSTTRTFYLRELLNPPSERIALSPGYKPVPQSQINELLRIESELMKNLTRPAGEQIKQIFMPSLGHQIESKRNWGYAFTPDPKDPSCVVLAAMRLPDDANKAIDLRDRLLAASGLAHLIPADKLATVTIVGNEPVITPQSLAAVSPSGLFGFSEAELNLLTKGDGFEPILQRQAAEIEALARELLDAILEADLDSFDEQLALAMELVGAYLLRAAQDSSRLKPNFPSDNSPDNSSAGGETSSIAVTENEIEGQGELEFSSNLDLSADLSAEAADLTISESDDAILVAEGDPQYQSDEDMDFYLNGEVESGDDGYEPIATAYDELDLGEQEEAPELTAEEEEAQLSLVLDLSDGAAETEEEGEKIEEEGEQTAQLLLEEQVNEQQRLKELIEELGGDSSLLSQEGTEVSPLGFLIGDGELPALSDLGEFNELLLAAEVAETIGSDYGDEGDSTGGSGLGVDGFDELDADEQTAVAEGEESVALVSEIIEASKSEASESEEVATSDAVLSTNANEANEENAVAENESALDANGSQISVAEQESDLTEEQGEERFLDEQIAQEILEIGGIRKARVTRRRAAMRVLNRLRYQAQLLGINIAELMKLRQRRGLKRLWFEQLVFALAREMKFTYEQRQALVRELELNSADFDDIRQAELAIRRELLARKLREKMVEPLLNT